MPTTTFRHRTTIRLGVLALTVAMLSSACLFGDDDKGNSVSGATALGVKPIESGLAEDAKPTRGGQLVYGLEAEADKGYCLPEAQLAISGMQVVRSLYDTLTVPDAKGGYAPYLAKAIDHNDDYTTWTIALRSGVTFHDGSPSTPRWSRTTSTPTAARWRDATPSCSRSCSPTSTP